ncbi:hypothetical protein Tco_0158691 [Tanacetum coccineum]
MLISYLDLTVDDFGLAGVEWFKMRINIRWILKDLRNLIDGFTEGGVKEVEVDLFLCHGPFRLSLLDEEKTYGSMT